MASPAKNLPGLLSTALLVSSAFLSHALALPGHAHSATLLKRQAEVRDEYDYIVVGGGTVGLTIADRLTEDGTSTDHPPSPSRESPAV
ncbi:hypothetical protein IMZ48_29815 [Candidatus Bathyarchaeota archaeon]|nr:hypothetical protein [Candidatus Bathyarchaeota archaeon]